MDNPTRVVSRSAFSFLSGTLLSRLSGLGRDLTMAFCFGSSPAIAAFMVAFRLSNLFRRLFGEGPLASGCIPHFESLRMESVEQGARFFRDLIGSILAILTLLLGGLEILVYAVWKWGNVSVATGEILYFTLLMLPGLLFICLFGIGSGLLQCEKKFFLTGFAPVAFNGVWILAAWCLKNRPASSAMAGLSVAIVIAFLMQWMMILPEIIRFFKRSLPAREVLRFQFFSLQLRRVIKPITLSIIGVSAVQISSALDAVFARVASLEGPAYLWYAIRIQQLPLALFGIALSSALLPPLSRVVQERNQDEILRLIRFGLRRSFSLIFPCTVGILVLGSAGVNLLYGRGDFSQEATYHTVRCLFAYGIGLIPAVLILILASCFYASKDYRTPVIASIVSVGMSSALSALFIFVLGWGALSVALATSFSAWVNCSLLFLQLKRRLGGIWDKEMWIGCGKTILCGLIAGVMTLVCGKWCLNDSTLAILSGNGEVSFIRHAPSQLFLFLEMVGVFGVTLIGYAWMTRATDLLELIGIRVSVNKVVLEDLER